MRNEMKFAPGGKNEKLNIKNLFIATLVALVISLALPAKTYAFWPFDIFTKSSQTESQAKFPTLIQRIIDKFKLDSGEVEEVINEVQEERRQEMRSRMEAKLEEAVKDGVITSEQKEVLLKRQDEMQQRQTQQREEWQKWMEESGIDFEKLAPYRVGFGGKGFGGRGFGRGHGFWKGF